MDRGAWLATVRGVTESQTHLKRLSMHGWRQLTTNKGLEIVGWPYYLWVCVSGAGWELMLDGEASATWRGLEC